MSPPDPGPGFGDDELAQARAYHRDTLAKQPRLDFDKPWLIRLVRLLANLATLDRRALKAHGLAAERREVKAAGRTVPVRIIRPKGPARALIVDIHGGGWTLARAATDDPVNAEFAAAGFAVVSVDYRYAPKTPLAEVIGDCETALAWALDNCETEFGVSEVVLNGESAGAHLAVAATLRRRDAGGDLGRLKGMVLFYGCYDLGGTRSVSTSRHDTLVVNGASLPTLLRTVTGSDDAAARRHPAISPLYAALGGLPPALLIVGPADPLVDDSLLMADRLTAASVDCQLVIVPDAPHSFNRLPTALANRTNGWVRAWIGARLAG